MIPFCDSDILSLGFVEHYVQQNVLGEGILNEKCTLYVLGSVDEDMLQTHGSVKADEMKALYFYISERFYVDVKCINFAVLKG